MDGRCSFLGRGRDFSLRHRVQNSYGPTGPRAHVASCSVAPVALPQEKSGPSVRQTAHVVPGLRQRGVTPPVYSVFLWNLIKHRDGFTFSLVASKLLYTARCFLGYCKTCIAFLLLPT